VAVSLVLWLAAAAAGQGFDDGLPPSPALAKLRGGDARGAIRLLRREPATPQVRKTLAVAYYAEKQFALFVELMRSVIAETPGDFAPYYYLGRHYDTDLRDFRTAASYFESAAERNRGHAPSYYHLGFCRERLGQFEASAKAYEQARALRKDYALSWLGLARVRLTTGPVKEAEALAKEAVRLAPADAAAHRVLARALSAAGKPGEAAAAWRRIAALDATDASAHYHLYRFYLVKGDKAKAEQERLTFERVRRIYGAE
jgi:tetratricopeptide (TPR) repeat protein